MEAYLQPLLELLGNAFAATHLSCYIWVSRKLLRVFVADNLKILMLLQFTQAISGIVFEHIKSSDASKSPDGTFLNPHIIIW